MKMNSVVKMCAALACAGFATGASAQLPMNDDFGGGGISADSASASPSVSMTTMDPTGACCQLDDTCAILTQADCESGFGFYAGNNTTCADNDGSGFADICEPASSGACCLDAGGCVIISSSQSPELDCQAQTGSYAGDDTDCTTDALSPDGSSTPDGIPDACQEITIPVECTDRAVYGFRVLEGATELKLSAQQFDFNSTQYVAAVGDDSFVGFGEGPSNFEAAGHDGVNSATTGNYCFGCNATPPRVYLPGLPDFVNRPDIDPFDTAKDGIDPTVKGGVADGFNDNGQFRDITLNDGTTVITGVHIMSVNIDGLGQSITSGEVLAEVGDTVSAAPSLAVTTIALPIDGTPVDGFRLVVDTFDGTSVFGPVTINRIYVACAAAAAGCPNLGDTNGDGIVDFADLTTLLANFNLPGGPGQGDTDGSGTVDFADLTTLLANFNLPCP